MKNSSFLREKSDYDDFFIASKKDAIVQLKDAKIFLGAVEEYLSSLWMPSCAENKAKEGEL